MSRLLTGTDQIFLISIIAYLPIIFSLKFFVDRCLSCESKKYLCDLLEMPWASWCFSLSFFSMFGSFYTFKYMYYNYNLIPIMETESGFWIEIFLLSKIPELLDTVFIVLRSKPLVALQWYHHFTTLLLSYLVSDLYCNEFVPFIFMNYTVHVFMYLYFALYCFFGKKLNVYGTFVNIIQTMQMFFAIGYGIYLYHMSTVSCEVEVSDKRKQYYYYYGIFMYSTFFVMFISLYFERVNRIKSKDEFFECNYKIVRTKTRKED